MELWESLKPTSTKVTKLFTKRKKEIQDKLPWTAKEQEAWLQETEHESKPITSQLIAAYLRMRKLTFATRSEANATFKRHLRAAKLLEAFDTEKVSKAFYVTQNDFPDIDWTLETVHKTITRKNL